MARTGQRWIQATHCTQVSDQTGFPSDSVMVPVGQTFSHKPHEMQASVTRKEFFPMAKLAKEDISSSF